MATISLSLIRNILSSLIFTSCSHLSLLFLGIPSHLTALFSIFFLSLSSLCSNVMMRKVSAIRPLHAKYFHEAPTLAPECALLSVTVPPVQIFPRDFDQPAQKVLLDLRTKLSISYPPPPPFGLLGWTHNTRPVA